jgi:hypothetical protein
VTSQRFSLLVLGWVGGLIAVPALFLWFSVSAQRSKLEKFRAELAEKGEKLKMSELAPAPSQSGAGAGQELIDISNKLHQRTKSARMSPARTLFMNESGAAEIAHLRETAWIKGREVSWDDFSAKIAPLRSLLADIRQATLPADLHLDPDYTKEYSMPLDFTLPPLVASQYLAGENLLLLREGNISTAIENIEAMLRFSTMLAEEPLMLSQIVSLSITGIAQASTWNVLQTAVARTDLQRLLASWERLRPSEYFVESLRMERAWCEAVMNAKDPPPDVSGQEQPHPAVEFAWRHCVRQKDEQLTLLDFQKIIDAASAKKAWGEIIAESEQLQRDAISAGIVRLVGARGISSVFGQIRNFPKIESLQKLTIAAIAIRLYAMDHEGAPPDTLQALVPTYLEKVPTDPMDKQPLRYKHTASDFVLYAIGLNNQDDSGATHSQNKPTSDISQRPDMVWPQCAP